VKADGLAPASRGRHGRRGGTTMKKKSDIETKLKAAKDFYEERREVLNKIKTAKSHADIQCRKVVLNQMLESAIEIETLEWVLDQDT
jgi:hypothetical protein